MACKCAAKRSERNRAAGPNGSSRRHTTSTTSGGVELRVTGQRVGEQRLRLSCTVTDSGIGFTERDEAVLYQRFYQLDGSMTRGYGGLGVGLAICRQLVELLGGRLHHQSTPGRGSRFELELEVEALPCAATPPARAAGPLAQRMPEACTVLLVDDNSGNQRVMRGMLLKLGYRVRTAEGCEDARAVMLRERIDAVLLDGHRLRADGVSLCCQLHALAGYADLPLLVATQAPERERCDGAIEYVSKPVKFEALQAILLRRVLCRVEGESADI